jgi:hypothetical protein
MAVLKSKSKLYYDRQSVGQSVLATRDQSLFLLEIFFRQLRVCYSVAPSLTRGWVCNLQLLLVSPAQSCGTQDHILLSHFLRLPMAVLCHCFRLYILTVFLCAVICRKARVLFEIWGSVCKCICRSYEGCSYLFCKSNIFSKFLPVL